MDFSYRILVDIYEKEETEMILDEKKLLKIVGGSNRQREVSQLQMAILESDECLDELKEKLKGYKENNYSKKQAALKLVISFGLSQHISLKTATEFVDKYWNEV